MSEMLIPLPKQYRNYFFNGCNEPCDMFKGPCACGAWHRGDKDFPKYIVEEIEQEAQKEYRYNKQYEETIGMD